MRALRSSRGIVWLLVVLLASEFALAAPPVVSHQGFLTNASGQPLNGTASLAFAIFAGASGGGALWSESHPSVPVVDGVYSVELGSVAPLPAGLFDGSDRWLEVTANGEPMTPRQRITSVPYALNAPISGIGDLAGKPCNPVNPLAGNLVVAYGLNGAVTLSCSAVYNVQVTITGGVQGTAGFAPPVTSSPAGISCQQGSGDCSEAYVGGTIVTLTAISNGNWTFLGWSGACTGTGSCVVTMDGAKSVTASYRFNL